MAIGINPNRTKTIAFAIAGFMAAFAGVVAATRVGAQFSPAAASGWSCNRCTGVIGGVAAGRGSILGVVLGTALVFTIQDVLLLTRAAAGSSTSTCLSARSSSSR